MSRRRLKLLHVFSTFAAGGPQVRFATLANAWGDRFEHWVQASDGCFDALDLIDHAHVRISIARDMPPMKGQPFLKTIWATGCYLRDKKPDLLLTYNWGATETALANLCIGHRPHIHHEDGFGPDEALRQNPKRIWFRRLALSGAKALIVPSLTLEAIAHDVWRIPRLPVHYIPNGVRLSDYAAKPLPHAIPHLEKQPGELWVGCVGGLRAEKNPRRLVRVFADATRNLALDGRAPALVMVGAGIERDAILADIAHLGIADKVHLPGFLAHPHQYLGLFDVYAVPSDTEQFPISLVEAMAAGLPVAATDVGDVRAILAEPNRRLVCERADEAAFAQNLRSLLSDPALRERLGAANKAYVAAHFQLDTMISTYERLYMQASG
jgi:L-malate glycosyltransferase